MGTGEDKNKQTNTSKTFVSLLCQRFRIIPDHLYSQEKIVKKDASRDGWDFVERARTFSSNTEQSRTFWKTSRRLTKTHERIRTI